MKYFLIMHGMRGCYMPDSDPFIVAVKTRRELRAIVKAECDQIDSGKTIGFSKDKISAFVAECWREAHKKAPAVLPYCLPYKEPGQSCFYNGVHVSIATRAEFKEQGKNDADESYGR